MPKKTEKPGPVDMIAWIDNLPEQGGAWGKGICDTVLALAQESDEADAQVVQLEAQIKDLKDKSAKRRSMAVQTARRAVKEAKSLFGEDVVKKVFPHEV